MVSATSELTCAATPTTTCHQPSELTVPKRSLIIHTDFNDLHALLIELAMRERGHKVLRNFGTDLPMRTSIDFRFGGELAQQQTMRTIDGEYALGDFDIVWNRRPHPPSLPRIVATEDRKFVQGENDTINASMHHLFSTAFCVNPLYAARAADCKPLQLHHAPKSGLLIPETLISNCPEQIRNFIASHPSVIYKPLRGMVWHEEGREFGSYTSRVALDDLPSDELLRAAPGIFQKQVQKQFEVRAQFFGASCLAARIESHEVEYGEFDWRLHQSNGVAPSVIVLPVAVHAACLSLMRALGLVAGAFDFIVTPGGDWVFLEVNEAGQFIFLETWCPQLSVIDAFCAFMESRDPAFLYRMPRTPRRLSDLGEQYALNDLLDQDRVRRQTTIGRFEEKVHAEPMPIAQL
jgi:hypothetical protein